MDINVQNTNIYYEIKSLMGPHLVPSMEPCELHDSPKKSRDHVILQKTMELHNSSKEPRDYVILKRNHGSTGFFRETKRLGDPLKKP
jgi:hypothetical protein